MDKWEIWSLGHSLAALRCLVLAGACAACDAEVDAPRPTFVRLEGTTYDEIAPAPPLVTVGHGYATRWVGPFPLTVELGNSHRGPLRWSADGETLRVGPGYLDVDRLEWTADPVLARWAFSRESYPRAGLRDVAWFEDDVHVAFTYDHAEVIILSIVTGDVRRRWEHGDSEHPRLLTEGERLLVIGSREVVLHDLDAKVIAVRERKLKNDRLRARAGAGMFALTSDSGLVELVRATDGELVGSWAVAAVDAIPMSGGAVAVADDGTVFVGCIEGSTVRTITTQQSRVPPNSIGIVGDQVVVVGYDEKLGSGVVGLAKLREDCSQSAASLEQRE